MVGTFQPLVENQVIVDENGKPTQYFIRFIQQRQEEIGSAAYSKINITAGFGLEGGGDLTQDRTLSLANSGVTAGTYKKPTVTFDSKGRATSASNGIAKIGAWFSSTPTANEDLWGFCFPEAVSFPTNYSGSVGKVETNPAVLFTLSIFKNGSPAGTVTISTGGVFTFTGSAVSFAVGDLMTIKAPPVADTAIKNCAITFVGTLL